MKSDKQLEQADLLSGLFLGRGEAPYIFDDGSEKEGERKEEGGG